MSLKPVAPDYDWRVKITWSRPADYHLILKRGSPSDSDAWLYMILGYYQNASIKLFYVGMVFQSHVSHRLSRPDHRQRYLKLKHDHPKHHLRVSLGSVEIENGNVTKKRIEEIETLIIFAHYNRHQEQVINKKKVQTHNITNHYTITNCGYRKPLFKEIQLGIFAR